MRGVLVASLCCVLAGCSDVLGGLPTYQPVVFQQSTTFEDDVAFVKAELYPITNVRGFLMKGMTIADSRCVAFFDTIEGLDARAKMARGRINALETGLPAILSAAGGASQAVSAVSAALGFVGGWIDDFQELYLLAEFRAEVFQYWSEARARAEQDVLAILAQDDIHREEAERVLFKYSQLCTRPHLMAFLKAAAGSGRVAKIQDNGRRGSGAKNTVGDYRVEGGGQ